MAEILMRWDGEKLVPVTNIQRVTMVVNSGGLLNQPKTDTSLPSFIPTTLFFNYVGCKFGNHA